MRTCTRKFVSVLMMLALVAGVVSIHHALADRDRPVMVLAPVTTDAAVALRTLAPSTQPVKAWATDLAGYSSSHRGQWIVGRCAKPCLSQAEAEQSAAADAAVALYPIVQQDLHSSRADEQWLTHQIAGDLAAGELVEDHLLESFTRSYGTLWTQTVLLDASPDKINSLLTKYRTQLIAAHAQSNGIRAGAVGVVLFAWLGYLLTNAITRGYFTLRLRLLAGTITAVAMVVLLGGT